MTLTDLVAQTEVRSTLKLATHIIGQILYIKCTVLPLCYKSTFYHRNQLDDIRKGSRMLFYVLLPLLINGCCGMTKTVAYTHQVCKQIRDSTTQSNFISEKDKSTNKYSIIKNKRIR